MMCSTEPNEQIWNPTVDLVQILAHNFSMYNVISLADYCQSSMQNLTPTEQFIINGRKRLCSCRVQLYIFGELAEVKIDEPQLEQRRNNRVQQCPQITKYSKSLHVV
jgi:hypothetical protein